MFKGYAGFQRFNIYNGKLMGKIVEEHDFQRDIDAASKVVSRVYAQRRL